MRPIQSSIMRRAGRLLLAGASVALMLGLSAQALASRAHPADALTTRRAVSSPWVAQAHTTARQAITAKGALHVAPQPHNQQGPAPTSPVAHLPAGAGTIVQNGQAPFAAALFHIENHWFEVKNGQTIIVYAGAQSQNPTQGVVVIEVASAGYTQVNGPFVYLTPRQDGSMHVAGASGERLTLAAADGATSVFDVARNAFVTP